LGVSTYDHAVFTHCKRIGTKYSLQFCTAAAGNALRCNRVAVFINQCDFGLAGKVYSGNRQGDILSAVL
jgi:hypothetical protein